GIVLASLLFMRDISEMTKVVDVTARHRTTEGDVPDGWSLYRINGPLFFAAADRIFSELALWVEGKQGIVLDLDAVPILDAGGLAAFTKFVDSCLAKGVRVLVANVQFQPLKT